MSWISLLFVVVLGLAYTMENPLFPRGIEPPGHTHAFDIYCQPFRDGSSDLPWVVVAKLKEDLKPFEQVGLIVLASVAALGLLLKALDRHFRLEDWLESGTSPCQNKRGWLDANLSPPVLGGVAWLAWWHSASSAASHTTQRRRRSSKRCTSFDAKCSLRP